jgi:hypothetical protein
MATANAPCYKELLHAWYTPIGYRPVRSGTIDENYPGCSAAGHILRRRRLPQGPVVRPTLPRPPAIGELDLSSIAEAEAMVVANQYGVSAGPTFHPRRATWVSV